MEQPARLEQWICRRQTPRFRLGMSARLITLERHLCVVLEDLSEVGSRITLPVPHTFGVCVLKWMDYHAFAEVRWMRERSVGLKFSSPIPAEPIEQTLRYAPDLVTQLKQSAHELRGR